ncbi:MAG: ACP S-malonyltransferase [Haliea sp.]|jgi:[acyl-carrier-protein] S-malonyltransferase|nr:ACP S-malonyltransferase [Haliea sp.]
MSENTVAFVFPGQGSQKVGMLADAHQQFQSVRDTFEEASQALGYDMWDLIQNGEQEALNLTETTQPVLLSSSVALWRAWQEQSGTAPAIMAGHSLGEFSALVCAGALGFTDAVGLVRQRGAFMQTAVPVGEGAMAAIIGLDDEAINRICTEVSGSSGAVVSAVNFNSPGQVVIAGHTGAVDTAIEALKEAGAKRAMPLPVSAPFHTELMKPAGERLAEAIANIDISTPAVPVVHNVHAETEADPEKIRGLLVEQIYSPVQWTRCVQTIVGQGVGAVVECGPGKVLSGLNRRIDKSLQSYSLEAPDSLVAAVEELK